MKRLFLAGHRGMVGSALLRQLQASGAVGMTQGNVVGMTELEKIWSAPEVSPGGDHLLLLSSRRG